MKGSDENMRKILLVTLIMVLLLEAVGCSNTQEKDTKSDEIQYVSPISSHNKDIFVSLPMEYDIVENHIQINGLTTLNEIKVEVYDGTGTLLNENNIDIELFDENGNFIDKNTKETTAWKSFNKYLYFNKKPTTSSGKVKIYSDKQNYIEIAIKFIKRLETDEQIKVLYPEPNASQKGVIRVYGYASVYEGVINYRVKGSDGNVLTEGQIMSTSGAPDTGLFAKDIPLEAKSQDIVLELYATSAANGEEVSKIEIPLKYQK
jgi:hypothetical protein